MPSLQASRCVGSGGVPALHQAHDASPWEHCPAKGPWKPSKLCRASYSSVPRWTDLSTSFLFPTWSRCSPCSPVWPGEESIKRTNLLPFPGEILKWMSNECVWGSLRSTFPSAFCLFSLSTPEFCSEGTDLSWPPINQIGWCPGEMKYVAFV